MREPQSDFQGELSSLLNRYSMENESNTPDFILARYIHGCLEMFDEAVRRRDVWYFGRSLEPGDGALAGIAAQPPEEASKELK